MHKQLRYASDEDMLRVIYEGIYRRENPDDPFLPPSQYISTLDSIRAKNPNIPVVPYYRVSTGNQARNENLQEGMSDLVTQLRAMGVNIAPKSFCEVRRGTQLDKMSELEQARRYAQKIGGVVVTSHVNRFVRPPRFHRYRNPAPQYPYSTLKKLQNVFGDTPFCTVSDPDLPESEVRSEQTKRGMRAKGNMGGRKKTKSTCNAGALKARRMRFRSRAIKLRARGYTFEKISNRLNVPLSTVADWVRDTP